MRILKLLIFIIPILCMISCSTTNRHKEANINSPVPTIEITPTSTPFVFEILPEDITPNDNRSPNIDQENQRLINTSLSSIQTNDSVKLQFIGTIIVDTGNTYLEIILEASGQVFGLSGRSSSFGFETFLKGELYLNGEYYYFDVEIRLVNGQIFMIIFADNFNELKENAQTPWLLFDFDDLFKNFFDDDLFQIDANIAVDNDENIKLPSIEDFFDLLSFNDYILTRRLPNVGTVAVFERQIDIVALLTSSDFKELLLLSGDLGGDLDMTEEELEQLILLLPQFIQSVFPDLELHFSQEVNLNNDTLNKIALDIDVEMHRDTLMEIFNDFTDGDNIHTYIDLVVTFSDFGVAVNVRAPDNYVPFNEYEIKPLPTKVAR